ncbi:hypothetical protein Ddye_011021 [Dipteronia dyeriana]|uniref:Uncharacterized protein n=1 Tax=Dipteronia dyeriana TaxID=168575 RepID=A0AAE0CNV7_9ROSI|nr:hypothetical protein Ddye_011021 [Dipteronia dyeriana]
MFLMETKCGVSQVEFLRVKLGFVGKLVVNSIGRSGGLYMFWSEAVQLDLLSFSRYHIDALVLSSEQVSWRLTRFYGNPEIEHRGHGWTLLRRL